jgi:hypothetical protein
LILDVENLGNSTLVSFMVINLVLLLGYFMDGREAIQATILEVCIFTPRPFEASSQEISKAP